MTCLPSSCCYHRLVVVFVFVFVVVISTVDVAVDHLVALPESATQLRVEETLQQEALLTTFTLAVTLARAKLGVVVGAQGGHLQTVQVRVPSKGMRKRSAHTYTYMYLLDLMRFKSIYHSPS